MTDTSDDNNLEGQILNLNGVEAWSEPVDAAQVLDELAILYNRYTKLPEHADTALALWTVFTWCIECFNIAPILAICSPERQCGKTTLLELVTKLVKRGLPTANISPSAVFRAIQSFEPTMIIDEADTFLKQSNELRGILNSGHNTATAFIIRNTGENHEPRHFSTWGAKAIALIGKLPETLHDRSIVIELRRKLTAEKTERLRHTNNEVFDVLRRKLSRLVQDNYQALCNARPQLPEDISDRTADNWEPLLAIAELAGEEWHNKALEAVFALSGRVQEARSKGTMLLEDVRQIFLTKNSEKVSTISLIKALCEDEERPWATYNRGMEITPVQVSKILSEYGVHSKTIRLSDTNTPKGYERKQFDEAFARYLPLEVAATTQQDKVFITPECGDVAPRSQGGLNSSVQVPF